MTQATSWIHATAIFVGVAILLGSASRLSAQEPTAGNPHVLNDQEAARKAFIEQFQRIGLNSAPGDAAMLRILVESSGAKRGVEVGTATGYGAILMGLGFERTGGHLTTVDIDPQMVATTRENLKKVGLDSVVTVVQGDALEVLAPRHGG